MACRRVVLSDAALMTHAHFTTTAMDLMALPRPFDTWIGTEADFVDSARRLLLTAGVSAADLRWLAAALERLHASGVLAARRMEEGIQFVVADHAAQLATVAADNAARGLRRCAAAECGATEVRAGAFKLCAACKAIVYCCREHQVADWPAHKAACKAARKAAADGGAGPSGAV